MKRRMMVLTAWLPLAAIPIHAAETPAAPPADLAALLKEAEANNPALQAAVARRNAATHLPSQAQVAPDPEVSVAYTNDGVSSFTLGESDMSVLALTWTQEVPHPGKLKRGGEVATFEAERVGKDLERARLEVAAAVKTGFADLYRLDRTSALLAETHTVLDTLAAVARLRYEVGEGIQESVLKAQTEILKLEAEQARVAQDRRAAEIRLNAAVGRSAAAPIGPATVLPPAALPAEEDGLVAAAVADSPEVGSLEAAVRRQDASLSLAKLDLKPDFIWSASYQNRGGLDPLVMGMFGLRLPLHRERKQAEDVLQKESELLASQKDLSSLKVTIQASVRELVSRVRRADRLLALFGQGVIPQAESTLESAQSSYQVGRIGFLEVLDDLTALFTARAELASEEASRLQALAALEPLLGRELVHASGGPGGEGDGNAINR